MKMFLSHMFSLFILVISACSAAPLVERQWDGMVVPRPSTDPWYNSTSDIDLQSRSPGDLIDKRAVEIPKFLQATVSMAWQVKFRTTDSRFRPTWAVTTLYTPKNRTNLAMVSYQHFTDSANVDDSPSYAILHHKGVENGIWENLVGGIADKNWYINLPDYEGPGASFAAGLMAGHATLDSIRAVQRLGRYTGLTPDVPVAMWGYSGGALATEWAAELQGSYAPELKITAAIMGGLTPNLTSVFYTTTSMNSTHADLVPKAVAGLAVQYPELRQDVMDATNTSTWDDAIQNLKNAANTGNLMSLRSAVNYLVGRCRVQDVLSKEGLMGYNGGVPQMPLFLHHAEYDPLAPIEDVRKLKDRYCGLSRATAITLRVNTYYPGEDGTDMHYIEGNNAYILVLGLGRPGWLEDAFAGRLPKGCTET